MTRKKFTTDGFFEKYKNPKWQKRRLEIMEASGFACERCETKTETLHVHHLYYISGREPWEYDASELACLCDGCHAQIHHEEDRLKSAIHEYKRAFARASGDRNEWLVGCLQGAAQPLEYRIRAQENEQWIKGFIFGAYRQVLVPNSFHALLEIIHADDGCLDQQWVIFFVNDSIWSKIAYEHVRENGFYWRDGFPLWFKNKINTMMDSYREPA